MGLSFGKHNEAPPRDFANLAADGAESTQASPAAPDNKRKPTRGKAAYPTKTTINLVRQDKARQSILTQVALFFVVLALIGVFGKFAVIDPLASGISSSGDVAAAQAQLNELIASNESYAELDEKYARYIVPGLTYEELDLANRNELLDLIEANLMKVGFLSSLKVTGNVVSATSLGADLTAVSKLVETLEGDSRVAHVTVSTAQGKDNEGTSATIEVTMKGSLAQAEGVGDDLLAEAQSATTGEGAENDAA